MAGQSKQQQQQQVLVSRCEGSFTYPLAGLALCGCSISVSVSVGVTWRHLAAADLYQCSEWCSSAGRYGAQHCAAQISSQVGSDMLRQHGRAVKAAAAAAAAAGSGQQV
jgi:hypothetical protein